MPATGFSSISRTCSPALAAAVETGTLEARVYRHWLAAAQDAERGGYHSDTFVGMVVSARKPGPGRAAIRLLTNGLAGCVAVNQFATS